MKHILLIDDDEEILEVVALLLEGTYRVSQASSGHAALDLLQTEAVDCIVLDLMMPNMSGVEFLSEVRARKLQVPVIIASARYDTPTAARRLNTEGYVVKPYSATELIAWIDRVTSGGTSGGSAAGQPNDSQRPGMGEGGRAQSHARAAVAGSGARRRCGIQSAYSTLQP